jgi:hypothetical protein
MRCRPYLPPDTSRLAVVGAVRRLRSKARFGAARQGYMRRLSVCRDSDLGSLLRGTTVEDCPARPALHFPRERPTPFARGTNGSNPVPSASERRLPQRDRTQATGPKNGSACRGATAPARSSLHHISETDSLAEGGDSNRRSPVRGRSRTAPSTWHLQIDGKRDRLSDVRRYACLCSHGDAGELAARTEERLSPNPKPPRCLCREEGLSVRRSAAQAHRIFWHGGYD